MNVNAFVLPSVKKLDANDNPMNPATCGVHCFSRSEEIVLPGITFLTLSTTCPENRKFVSSRSQKPFLLSGLSRYIDP
jgi:hypothetical protein